MSTTIGGFQFDFGRGNILLVQKHTAKEVRPGQDGMDVLAIGAWGDPFPFQTESYHDTYANGIARSKACEDLQGSLTPLTIIHEPINYTTAYGVHYLADSVKTELVKSFPYCNRAVNHLDGPLYGPTRVIINWVFIPVILIEEP